MVYPRQVIIAILLFAPAGTIVAAQPGPAVRRACMDDAKKFCSSIWFNRKNGGSA
jgi:hypothetical protein